jgi:hypothetical protein
MITGRRLAKLEGALSPKAATLLWLAEAHRFPSLSAYVAWLVDQPQSAAPLYRVPEASEAGVRAALRGERRDAVERSVREAVRQAVFLVELIVNLNTAAEETARLDGLRYTALFWEMRAISAEAQLEGAGPARDTGRRFTARWAAWRAAVASLIGSLYVAEEARAHLEGRYLDRTPTLFPDLAMDWQALREQAERLAGRGDVLGATTASINGACHRRSSSRRAAIDLRKLRAAARDRAPDEAAPLVDTTRAAALDALGDTVGAAAIAERRIRAER